MSKVFNMVGGGSGKNISSIIINGLGSTDAVTCTKDDKTYPATWDETTKHWEIVGLPLGTFTVTSTNGTNTKTETVLIDITGVYEIEMSYVLWLYKEGDECEDVTGGWTTVQGYTSTTSKESDHVRFAYSKHTSYGSYGNMQTANSIDITGFDSLHIVGTIGSTSSSAIFIVDIGSTRKTTEHSSEEKHEFVVDISDITGSQTIKINVDSDGNLNSFNQDVFLVWIE